MSNINRDYEKFINQTDARITQPILRWGLVSTEEQRLVRIAHFRAGGTFPYLHHVCKWVKREVNRLTDAERPIENYIFSLVKDLDKEEVNIPRDSLS